MAKLTTEEEYLTSQRLKEILKRVSDANDRMESNRQMLHAIYAGIIAVGLIALLTQASSGKDDVMKYVQLGGGAIIGWMTGWLVSRKVWR